MLNFREFIKTLVIEELHPELRSVVTSDSKDVKKQHAIAMKINDLSIRGEKTGIEGNVPEGSSRAYLKHAEPHKITLDGQPAKIPIGTKVAIRGRLDDHHNKAKYQNKSLGQLQNESENADSHVNSHYRVLTHTGGDNYTSNKKLGIFPPLVEHDHKHEWSKVGHAKDLKPGDFEKLTKAKHHPTGIGHDDFCDALERDYNKANGKYWKGTKEHEKNLDSIAKHPLVKKFIHHQRNMSGNPFDYRQEKNMGIFEHPDGSKHIVARDHGFDHHVSGAYKEARKIPRGPLNA